MSCFYKYFTTAIVGSCFFLSVGTQAGGPDSSSDSEWEPVTKLRKVSPRVKEEIDPIANVVVKTEPCDDRRNDYPWSPVLTTDALRTNAKKFNPAKGKENGLDCTCSFYNWVKTGNILPVESTNQTLRSIKKKPQNDFDRPQQDSNFIYIGETVLEHINSALPRKIEFQPCQFSELNSTLLNLPRLQGEGSDFVTGILFLDYEEDVLDKGQTDPGFVGHFLNFYISKSGGKPKIWVTDAQYGDVFQLSTYINKHKNIHKPTVYFWSDKTVRANDDTSGLVKKEESEEDVISSHRPPFSSPVKETSYNKMLVREWEDIKESNSSPMTFPSSPDSNEGDLPPANTNVPMEDQERYSPSPNVSKSTSGLEGTTPQKKKPKITGDVVVIDLVDSPPVTRKVVIDLVDSPPANPKPGDEMIVPDNKGAFAEGNNLNYTQIYAETLKDCTGKKISKDDYQFGAKYFNKLAAASNDSKQQEAYFDIALAFARKYFE